MSFIQSGNETRIYRISSDNKLDGMYGGCFFFFCNNDVETFLLNFLMYLQITSTDSYIATQNCIQKTESLQN